MKPSLVPFAPLLSLALLGCGRGPAADRAGGTTVATAPASASAPVTTASASPSASPPAVPESPPPDAKPPTSFVGAKTEKACRAQVAELATYQTRGDIALAGQGDTLGATWRVRLAGKREEQVAFGTFDKDGHAASRTRSVGTTSHDAVTRVFAAGAGFAVVWFDDKGLAYAFPRVEPMPAPDVQHLGAITPDVSDDVALSPWPTGGAAAAAPFAANRTQLGVFAFASADGAAANALGVTHHAKAPRSPAVASGPAGTFVAWEDGGALLATRFDAAGKEIAAACTLARPGPTRERLALVATAGGALAMWMEGDHVKTRALDTSACPSSPIWPAAEGKWAALAPFGESAILAWVGSDGRLLAARLGANGAAPARGIEVSEGSTGVKDAPAVATVGGRVAFGWAEMMSPVVAAKRLLVRLVDAGCVP